MSQEDGKIVISTKLDNTGIKKDMQEVNKIVSSAGKTITDSMNKAEKSMKNASSAFDGKKIATQLKSVESAIDKANSKIDSQKKKLTELKASYEKATDIKSKNKIEQDMQKAEASIVKLETRITSLNNKKIKLDIDKNALNGLDGEFRSASETATKELDKIEKKAKETGASVKKSLSNIDIGERISKVGDKISGIGNTLTSHVTLPLVGIGIAAAKVGMDFDASMSRVKAISGSTGEEFNKLKEQALQLGADTAFSSKQAAEGQENLASAGFTTNEIISAMPGLLNLAASSGESLASSSDIAASTLRGFGLEAAQAGHVADVLAKNAGATNAAVADTGEAMKYIAPVAHSMGLGLEEVTAAIGEMANSGIKGSQAGTTLRSALTRLASPADPAATAMEKIGFKAFDAQGKLKSLSTIMDEYSKALEGKTDQEKQDLTATIFGQEAMSGMMVLMDGGKKGLDDLTNAYKTSDGAAADMAKTMQDNSKSALEQMTGSLETTAIKLEEDFAPVIIQICNEIQNLANAFSELSPEQQEFYAKTLLAVAVGGPALKLVGGLTSRIGGLVSGVSKLAKFLGPLATAETALGTEAGVAATGGIAAFGGSLAAIAPVALPIIAALAAVSVGVAAVATANDQMSDKLTTTTDDMTEWQKAINGMTGYTFKSKKELSDLGIEYKQFGDNISDNFKKKVEESTDTLHKFELFLQTINLDGIITDNESSDFNNQINKMVNDAIASIKGKQSESQESLKKLFMLDDNTLDETEKKVLNSISKGFDTQITEENQLKTDILAIKQKAVDEKRALNEQEIKDVKDKTEKIKQIELDAVGGTAEEKSYSKNEFGARVETVSATDASKLLQDKKKALDEENVQIKASYDTQIDMLKQHVLNEDGTTNQEVQTEIDKFTKLRDEKTKLKTDEWQEYIRILKEKNPEALALINTFNGETLKKEDKDAQDRLSKMKETYKGLNQITQNGTYKMLNTTTNSNEDITVTVDEATGKIIGAYSSTSGEVAGYTDQMAKDNADLGRSHTKLAAECQNAMNNLSGAHIDASGKITSASGKIVGSLEEIVTENGKVVSGIYNLNGTPIKIETNADGTIKNIKEVKEAIENVPKEREIAFKIFTTGETAILAGYNAMKASGNSNMSYEDYKKSIGRNYTGTNGGDEGLSYVNEHGWEISSGSEDIAYLGSGSSIMPHMTSVNEMNQEISQQVGNSIGKIINTLANALGIQNNLLSQVVGNTGKTVQLNEKMATNLIANLNKNTTGTFSGLQNEITAAQKETDHANSLTIEQNKWYAESKAKLDDTQSKIDELRDKIDETEDKTVKESLEKQQKVLEKQKDSLDIEVNYYKDAAQKEIEACKDNAKKQVDIANEKKEKLTKLAEATTNAIKAQLEQEKTAADKVHNDKLKNLETEYNTEIANIDKVTKKKTDSIDEQIKALEEQTTDTTREDERKAANDNINMLSTKMANTKSQADKDALALQIKDAQKELNSKEDAWNIEDQKAQLEEEKTLLSEKADAQKETLKEEYETQKTNEEDKLKATDEYYSKLLETDSLNAQTRYTMLTDSSEQLVALLNSYAPGWQDAGQTLADSLLTGLNSSKQSVQDAVNSMVALRSGISNSNTTTGYASGTSYNQYAGLYNVDEKGFETTTSGSVAYVSKGAAIKNNMQSQAYIDSSIAKQVAEMKASILASQADMMNQVIGNISNTINSANKNITNNNAPLLHADNINLNTGQDVEQLARELDFYRVKQQKA